MTTPPKSHKTVAVVFAGGVGLGAYQGGAYAALHEREDLRPRWLAGSSVGAVNAALIAGNAPEHRVERLREFWAEGGPLGRAVQADAWAAIPNWRHAFNWMSVIQSRLIGAPGHFRSRLPTMLFEPGRSLYDLAPMRERLERLVDFERLNSGETRICVATTDIETGEPVLFDTGEGARIGIDHLMASCGFLPEFAPLDIGGRLLGDGGLSMNAPLEAVLLRHEGDGDLLCIVLDLFARDGSRPSGLESALARKNDLLFANQTHLRLELLQRDADFRAQIAALFDRLPDSLRANSDLTPLANAIKRRAPQLLSLSYRAAAEEAGPEKQFDLSRATIDRRWAAGFEDMEAGITAIAHNATRTVTSIRRQDDR
jgi:NTE family protein